MSGTNSGTGVGAASARILICDDDPVSNAMVKACLQAENFRVDIVFDAEEAMQEIRKVPFDLVLLDVEMPGMSGVELTHELRHMLGDKQFLPIVLLTAMECQQARLAGLQAGATDFLTKPFDPVELVARIRNHVSAKRLHDRLMVANKALEDERAKVFKVQQDLLPKAFPVLQGLRFAAGYLPCNLAGGDFYDVVQRGDGSILLAVGDVSGHGIPSAMYMSILRATLRTKAEEALNVEEIVHELNRVLRHGLDSFSFVTFLLAEYEPSTTRLRYLGAGHPPPLVLDLATGDVRELPMRPRFPLGLEEDLEAGIDSTHLGPNKRIFFYTDGITDQPNRSTGARFDAEGLAQVLQQTAGLHLRDVPNRIFEQVNQFAGGSNRIDDMTILGMEILR